MWITAFIESEVYSNWHKIIKFALIGRAIGCYSSRGCRGNFSMNVGKAGCCAVGGGLSYRDNDAMCQECYSKLQFYEIIGTLHKT